MQIARQGRFAEAIEALRALATGTADPRVAYDLATVQQWSGLPQEALHTFAAIGLPAGSLAQSSVPDYVLFAVAQAQRDLKQFEAAEQTARALLARQQGSADATVLLALILADQRRGAEARAVLGPLLMTSQPASLRGWLALGYIARQTNDPFTALRAYSEVLRLEPGQHDAQAAMAAVLRDLGAPFGAAGYSADPGSISLSVRAQQAALMLRWSATVTPPPGSARFAATDRALTQLEALIEEALGAGASASEVLATLRRDHVLALRQRERWADALVAVDALAADNIALPAYVRQAQADSLLALRRPAEARRIYTQLIAGQPRSPVNREAYIGRFYAEVEDEDFEAAFATVDTLAAQGSAWRVNPGTGRVEENNDWLSSQILAGQARNYGDVPGQAWARLSPLAGAAPALGYLRSALAGVAASRGWQRRAETEIKLAASLAPEDRGVRVGLADSALRRRDASAARRISADLLAQSPGDSAVQRLARDIALNDKAEWRVDVAGSRELGDASSSPGGGLTAGSRLRSGPLRELWRAQVALERSTSKPAEGRIVRDRLGAGAVYQGPDLDVELMGWTNSGALRGTGASVDAAWQLSDQWSVYVDAERFARDTPLRALFYGISADAAGAGVQYRWHESRSLLLSARTLHFSDGNRRTAQRLAFSQRVFDAPHFKLTARPEYFASQNSRTAAPYFNPVNDQALTLTLEAEHMIYRRYDRSWVQRVRASVGRYAQAGFATGSMGLVAYEQVYDLDPSLQLRWGIETDRRVYDGKAERKISWFAGATRRF
ncbi:poly-beta-1,6 N-acetyl-D-glucosamine export porin PgaA [Polaromonas eurypsychrophila]|uniref:Poly-beta-1,6 N-acetyl-D-glucosamine export porin PgaA n=1 Tax=Polaromonas eurypsychrophila TaxID=1614635 RepID=A0A916WCN7_9BURK|nr:poly-beta-1,6 N-acetyl-D-glucosamine export porin PgaA [Polaromonas eurypsychrophila]